MSEKASYAQILKTSSIMGGTAGINLLLGIVRTKFAALLIGTTGVGLLASLTAIQGFIGIIAGLGMQTSAVREVAAAVSRSDDQTIGRAILTLRRISWLTGLVGMIAMIALSPFLSQLTFDSPKYTVDIAALGVIILLGNISGGQMALIQGMRRIGDMARAGIIAAALATISAIGFYSWLGLRGIVPSLVAIAVMQLVISWYFARRVPVPTVELSWRETFTEASGMVRLGLVFMWTGLMNSAVGFITITLITQQVSLQAVGIYSAAFALSGMFVNFILQSMAADYYPSLTGLVHNKAAMNRLVNEQTEIGLLLAMPGILATIVLAPWIIQIFYTNEFLPAGELLQWFVLGVFGRVVAFPLGYVMAALGKGALFALSELIAHSLHVLFIWFGLKYFGINGVGIAFALLYVVVIVYSLLIAKYLTGFVWLVTVRKILFIQGLSLVSVFLIMRFLPLWPSMAIGLVFTVIITIFSFRELIDRIGHNHKISKLVNKIPLIRMMAGLK